MFVEKQEFKGAMLSPQKIKWATGHQKEVLWAKEEQLGGCQSLGLQRHC